MGTHNPHSNSLCRQWDIKCVGHFFLIVAVLFDTQKQGSMSDSGYITASNRQMYKKHKN